MVEAGIVLPHEDVAVLHGGADGPVRCRDAQAGTGVMPRSVLGLEHVHAVAALVETRCGDAQLLVKIVHERPHDRFEGRRSILASLDLRQSALELAEELLVVDRFHGGGHPNKPCQSGQSKQLGDL